MDYKEFVEELVKEIKKETGFRVEFCAADEEEYRTVLMCTRMKTESFVC